MGKSCVAGMDEHENKKFRSPWTCEVLTDSKVKHGKEEFHMQYNHRCKSYGCHGYAPLHACQCNEVCKYFHNCCPDYEETCGKKDSTTTNTTTKAKTTLKTRSTTTPTTTTPKTTTEATPTAGKTSKGEKEDE